MCSCLTTEGILHARLILYAIAEEEDGGHYTFSHVKFLQFISSCFILQA